MIALFTEGSDMTETRTESLPDSPSNPGPPGTLLFENDRVRVWELVMNPGEICNWHQHNDDHLLIVVNGSDVEAENADGTTSAVPDSRQPHSLRWKG